MNNLPTEIDLAILSRDESPLRHDVLAAVRGQRNVRVRIHRVIGRRLAQDVNRWQTIVRARNEALRKAQSPWLMFLDDDVVLARDCVARLQHALEARPEYAGLAADYNGEQSWRRFTPHVGMGATLFRRSVLQRTGFRWEAGRCECLCCCDDLRRQGFRIEYLPGARAQHLRVRNGHGGPAASGQPSAFCGCECDSNLSRTMLKSPAAVPQTELSTVGKPTVAADASGQTDEDPRSLAVRARIMVAFDRRDVGRFRKAFLTSLRNFSNVSQVIVVGYGLYPSESRLLSGLPGVHVVNRPANGQMAPVRRLADFGQIVSQMEPDTPVAYWDAADVIFQGSLNPLWELTQQHPDRLLAVREPRGYPGNAAITGWTRTISDRRMASKAFHLFASNPFLNSGFAAGTAAVMARYFREAGRLRHSPELKGTSDWGDQSALNLYCHSDPNRWIEVSEAWNFCVHDRPVGCVFLTPDGFVRTHQGTPIRVVHGNARSLTKLAIIR